MDQEPESRAFDHVVNRVEIHFTDPKGFALSIDPRRVKQLTMNGAWKLSEEAPCAAWNEILEVKIPFSALGLNENQELAFYVEVMAPDRASERYPRSCALQMTVPPLNIQEHEWMV